MAWYRPNPVAGSTCSTGDTSGNTHSQFQVEFEPGQVVQGMLFALSILLLVIALQEFAGRPKNRSPSRPSHRSSLWLALLAEDKEISQGCVALPAHMDFAQLWHVLVHLKELSEHFPQTQAPSALPTPAKTSLFTAIYAPLPVVMDITPARLAKTKPHHHLPSIDCQRLHIRQWAGKLRRFMFIQL